MHTPIKLTGLWSGQSDKLRDQVRRAPSVSSLGWEKRSIVETARAALGAGRVAHSVVYWNAQTLKEGEEVLSGLQTLRMPFEGTVVFVDLAPTANWAHPCLYLFIHSGAQEVSAVESSFPPAMDRPGGKWTVILRDGKPPDEDNPPPFERGPALDRGEPPGGLKP